MLGYSHQYVARKWDIDTVCANRFGSITIRMILNDVWDEGQRLLQHHAQLSAAVLQLKSCTAQTDLQERVSHKECFSRCGECVYRWRVEGTKSFDCSLYRNAGINHTPQIGAAACRALWSENERQFLIHGLLSRCDNLMRDIKDIEHQLDWLRLMERRASPMPPLPEHRPEGWFRVGSTVTYKKSGSKHFCRATITELPDVPAGNTPCATLRFMDTGKTTTTSVTHPWLLKAVELEFLQDNPEFLQLWMKTSRKFNTYASPTRTETATAVRNGLQAAA